MGKDYFVRIIMEHGEAYDAVTSTNLNRLGLLRMLPVLVELKNPKRFPVSGPGFSFGHIVKPEEEYERYVEDLERLPSYSVEGSIKVVPQKICTLVFCEEVSELEEKLQEE